MASTAQRTFIECIGLPGSGKTTITETVRSHPAAPPLGTRQTFRESTVIGVSKLSKVYRQAKLFARFPSLFSLLRPSMSLAWSSPQTREEVIAFLLELATAREALDRGPSTALFHEGACQRIFSISLTRSNRLPLTTTRELLDLVTAVLDGSLHVIHVRIPPDEAASRIRSRASGWKRWNEQSLPDPIEMLETHRAVFDTLVGLCHERCIPVLEVDGQAPLEANRREVLDHVQATVHAEQDAIGQPADWGSRLEHVGRSDD